MKFLIVALALIAVVSAFPKRTLWHNLRRTWVPVNSGNEDDKIVGGDVTGNALPYQISLQLKSGGKYHHICGGSIGRKRIIITAAHCVVDFTANQLRVVVGEYDLSVAGDESSIHAISQIITHEKYNSFTLENDIALLRLATPIKFDDKVKSVSFTDTRVPLPGTELKVSGWGTLSSGGASPNKLHEVNVPVMSNSECKVAYGSEFFSDEMFCAGKAEGGVDSCQGDSGGPIVNGENLVGVVSWGYGCAVSGYPGVYTRLSNYMDWAKSKLRR